MKLLWISNAPWQPSGYGSQTRQAGLRIANAGYEIEFVANDGTRGNNDWNGLLVRGSGQDRYSRDSIREDLAESGADWVISLYDAWVYTSGMKDPFEGIPHVAGWVPVDHWPAPPVLYDWLSHGHMAIAMSRFGAEWLGRLSDAWRDAGKPTFPVRYVPHAIDDVFRPTESGFRQAIDVPLDAFLVGIVASNTGSLIYDRKGMADMAAALGMFMSEQPDAYVYIHSMVEGPEMMSIPACFEFNGVDPSRIRYVDQYALKKHAISDAEMAERYSAFDVLLSTSRGEGFGVPVIEAQGCGTPVIASNWTAQTELLADDPWSIDNMGPRREASGWLVVVDPDYDPRQLANFGKPIIPSIVAALREAYTRRGDASLRDAAIAKAEGYRADVVFDTYWRPLLAEMETRLAEPQPIPIPINRAARRDEARKAKRAAR